MECPLRHPSTEELKKTGNIFGLPLSLEISVILPLSICPSACVQFFLRKHSLFFLHDTRGQLSSKTDKTRFFGKFSFRHIWAKLTKNRPKRDFILFLLKNICHLIFQKIVQNERLPCYLFSSTNLISGRILVLEILHKILQSNQIAGF